MAVATGTAILIGAGIAGAGAITSSVIQSEAAKDAAREQRKALQTAQAGQEVAAEKAATFQQPFLDVGQDAFMSLADIIQQQVTEGVPDTGLGPVPQFEAPEPFEFTLADIQQDPGIQFAQEQAQKAVERSAAGRGRVLGGGTLRELQREATGLSALQSQQAFERKYLPFQQDFSNQLAAFQQNLTGRQQSLSEIQGQRAERQQQLQNLSQIAQQGPTSAANIGNILTGQAANTANLGIQMGNVNAAQRVAQGQALSQGIGAGTDFLNTLIMMNALRGGGNIGVNQQQLLPVGAGDLSAGTEGLA